jgi:hypothetical protein
MKKRIGNRVKFRMGYLTQKCQKADKIGGGVVIVVNENRKNYVVRLTRDCGSYRKGNEIYVWEDEVI